ncbi:MAG: peptidoglycan-binding protein [Humibacillus sp.]
MEQQTRQPGAASRCLAVGAALTLTFGAAACSSSSPPGAAATKVVPSGSSASSPSVATTSEPTATAPVRTAIPTTTASPLSPDPTPAPAETVVTPVVKPLVTPVVKTVAKPTRAATPNPTPTPESVPAAPAPRIVLRAGDSGPTVRALQARLRQIGWYSGDVANRYGPKTTDAVRGFQGKRSLPVTGATDEVTYAKLLSMTTAPTADELANVTPTPVTPTPAKPLPAASWDVDERCMTGRVMCVSKSTRHLTWVVDGVPQYGFDVRFGSDELPTREGVFAVYLKKVDVISNLYHTPMPYSMFFSGGQAVHYSTNFARLGYAGASHGCVNVRDKALLVKLYDEVAIGDQVVVHW